MLVLQSLFGLIAMLGIAILLSEDRRRIAWRPVAAGVALQLVLALVMVKLPLSQSLFAGLNQVVLMLDKATTAGTSFVFGYLGGDALPFEVSDPSKTFVLAFQALPLVIVVSALSALLFYWRVLPWVVTQLARLLTRSMGIGGEIFLLDMGTSIKIDDMARDLIRLSGFEPDVDINIEYIGLRPGEKLTEELLTEAENLEKTELDKTYILKTEEKYGQKFLDEISAFLDEIYSLDDEEIKLRLRKFTAG